MKQLELLVEEIKLLIEAEKFDDLKKYINELNISEVEDLVDELPENAALFIDTLDINRAAMAFRILDVPTQERVIKKLSSEKITQILNELAPDDRASFLGEMKDEALAEELTDQLSLEDQEEVSTILAYPEDSVGRLMTPDYLAIDKNISVEEALNYIRIHGKNSETIDVIYILDEKGVLLDDLRIRELLLCDPKTKIADLMDERMIYLNALDSQEAAVQVFKMNNRVALPVINANKVLLGIVTVDDILWVAEEGYAEDMHRFGGTESLDEPYMDMPLLRLIKKRASWLVFLFVGELFTASVMQIYESQLAKLIILAMFLPLMISSGGNSGSQASTLIIQAMARGEVKLIDWLRVFRREIISGLGLGVILGAVGFFRIYIWHLVFPHLYGLQWILVGFTVAISLIGIVLWGSLVGAMLPFILKRLGADPATSSAPFVATIVDVTGLLIYFSIGTWIFSSFSYLFVH